MQVTGNTLIKICKDDLSEDGSFIVPENIVHIGSHAFSGCSSLTRLKFNKNLTKIGYAAFAGCTALRMLRFNEDLRSISSFAFKGCTGLTTLRLNEKLTTVDNAAFYGCSGLTAIALKNLTKIGDSAFEGCAGLTTLILNENLTEIGKFAFYNDKNAITQILINGGKEEKASRIKALLPNANDLQENDLQEKVVESNYARRALNEIEKALSVVCSDPKNSRLHPLISHMLRTESVVLFPDHLSGIIRTCLGEANGEVYIKAQDQMRCCRIPRTDDLHEWANYTRELKKIAHSYNNRKVVSNNLTQQHNSTGNAFNFFENAGSTVLAEQGSQSLHTSFQ